jgi:hypothetical protein
MTSPTINLTQLRERLQNSQEIVMDRTGQIRTPDDPAVRNAPQSEKTMIKPTRWF